MGLVALLSGCMAIAACGASSDSLGESEQPLSEDAEDGALCELGVPVAEGAGPSCQVVARGLCFETAEAACACGGCELAECAIAESFPAQAFCQSNQPASSDPDGSVSDGDTSTSSPGAAQGSGTASNSGSSPGCADPTPPAPAVCEGGVARPSDTETRCDFLVDGLCFDDSAAACACAGCAPDRCLILESAPAQIACQ